ncbi:MAG: DUF6612 family protein [Lachnospiraceae bacterium]
MKKLLAFALSAVMLACPFTSYAAQTEEGIAVYQEMLAQSNTLNDIHAYYDMNLGLSGSGVDSLSAWLNPSDLNMRMQMDIKMANANDLSQVRFSAYSRISVMGEQMDFNMYYENGWMYMEMDGEKQKVEMPLGEMQSSIDSSQSFSNLLSSETFMKDLSVRTEGENRILSYRMDDAMLNQLVQKVLEQAGYTAMMDSITLNVRNVYGDYVINPSGYYTNSTVHMEMEMVNEGESFIFTIDGSIGIPNPGEAVDIPTPDLSGYVEA